MRIKASSHFAYSRRDPGHSRRRFNQNTPTRTPEKTPFPRKRLSSARRLGGPKWQEASCSREPHKNYIAVSNSGKVTESQNRRPLTCLRAENKHPKAPAADSHTSKDCSMGNAASVGSRLESKARLAVSYYFLFLRAFPFHRRHSRFCVAVGVPMQMVSRRITEPQALANPGGKQTVRLVKVSQAYLLGSAVLFVPCLGNRLIFTVVHASSMELSKNPN